MRGAFASLLPWALPARCVGYSMAQNSANQGVSLQGIAWHPHGSRLGATSCLRLGIKVAPYRGPTFRIMVATPLSVRVAERKGFVWQKSE